MTSDWTAQLTDLGEMAEHEHQRSVNEHRQSIETFAKQIDRLHGRKLCQRVGSKSWKSSHIGLPYTKNHPGRELRKNGDLNLVYDIRDLFTTFGDVQVSSEGDKSDPFEPLSTAKREKSDPREHVSTAASEAYSMALHVARRNPRYGSKVTPTYPSSTMSSSNESSPVKPRQTEEKATTPQTSPTGPSQAAEEILTPQSSPKQPSQTSEKATPQSSPSLSGPYMPATSLNSSKNGHSTHTSSRSPRMQRTTIKNWRPYKTLNPMKITKSHLKPCGARRPTHHLAELMQKPQSWRSMAMVEQQLNSQYQIVHYEIATDQLPRAEKKAQGRNARKRRRHSCGRITRTR